MTYGELRMLLAKAFAGADPDLIDQAVNNRLESIEKHLGWKALEKDARFVTVAVYQTGTVALTLGSTSVALTGGAFDAAMTGRRFRALGHSESYGFTYVSPSQGTLDRAWEGDTGAGLGFIIYRDTYDLAADYRSPGHAVNERLNAELRYQDQTILEASAPARTVTGEPLFWAEVSRQGDTRRAQLYPVPEFAASYPYRYIAAIPRMSDATAGTDVPAWISARGLLAGAKAELGAKDEELIFQYELSQMRAEDSRARGTQRLRMAPVFTRHRLARSLGRRIL